MLTLAPFQREGTGFLTGLPRGYLGDEPGLGKTAQSICAANYLDAKSIHVFAPAGAVNWQDEIEMWADSPERWTVSSYATADQGFPEARTYICDEAHYLNNPLANRSIAILGAGSPVHRADNVWPLSGTPAPNNVWELHNWLRFMRATTMTRNQFLEHFCKFYWGEHGPKITGTKRLPELQALLKPVHLRRLKKDVLKDVPPATWDEIALVSDVETLAIGENIFVEEDDLPDEDEHLSRARRILGEAKAHALGRFLAEEIFATGEKIVIMAQHVSVLDTLATYMTSFGVTRIDGSVSKPKRRAAVRRFQTDPDCLVFLGQISAAGTAITLTAACDLVFAEMSWVPGDNKQAADRVHRIGQTRPVRIRVALLAGSLDEAVSRVLARKTRLLQQIFEG